MTHSLLDLDNKARTCAIDPNHSFIIKAPAGSGKTELLIQRFLTLLSIVNKPQEILSITFTKKAANEMRMRVLQALREASLPEPEAIHKKQTWLLAKKVLTRDQQMQWDLIANPNQLRIQTIDSLCSFLTHELPLLSHFGAMPEITDEPTALYSEAVQTVLMHLEEKVDWADPLAQLLMHLDNDLNQLHQLLINLLAKRDQWFSYIHLNDDDVKIRKKLEYYLAQVNIEGVKQIYRHFPTALLSDLLSIAQFCSNNCRELTVDLHLTSSVTPKTITSHKKLWTFLAKILLTSQHTLRKRVDSEIGFPALNSIKNPQEKKLHQHYRKQFNNLIESVSQHENLLSTLSDFLFLPPLKYENEQWIMLKNVLYILKIVAAQLRVTFQQQGKIDFIENAQAALLALGQEDNPTDLTLALDYQIRHILVDEFQDTSLTQYQLLEKLTMGWEANDDRTLFVVGDPMQSIYRFREAEVGLFIRMIDHGIGQLTLKPLSLAVNFRSAPQIVEWNNEHFSGIFPKHEDYGTGAVTFSKSVANKADYAGDITVKGFVNESDSTQACYIRDIILDTKTKHPNDTVAILIRSRLHLTNIVPILKQAKISFHAVDIDLLATKQIIQDLLSLTCAMLHPADRLSWLAVFRAPWCGLLLSDLLLIAKSSRHLTIWEMIPKSLSSLSIDGQKRLTRVMDILKPKIQNRQRENLRSWIESTWYQLGGPACLTSLEEIDEVSAYFNLLSNYSKYQSLNLETLKEKVTHLYASPQLNDQSSVQIMTIHAAKGLEFDTVILPHLERKMPNDDYEMLNWLEKPLESDDNALLIAPIHAKTQSSDPIYQYITRQQRLKSVHEVNRLLYVATTRAKKRLYLSFNTTLKENADYKIEPNSFLEKLWPMFKNHLPSILDNQNIKPINENKSTSSFIYRLASDWQYSMKESNPQFAYHHQSDGFLFPNHMVSIVGIVLHKWLEQTAKFGITWWQEQSIQNHQDYVSQKLIRQGLLPKDLPQALQFIFTGINNTLSDPRALWILKSRPQAESELAITAQINNSIEKLVIDRTFVENGNRWIVDYKTTAFSKHDLQTFLEKAQEKYLPKMLSYAKAMQQWETYPIKFGLYFPVLKVWHEWENFQCNTLTIDAINL